MSGAVDAVRRLQRVAGHFLRGEPLAEADRLAHGEGLENWIAGRESFSARELYENLGIAIRPGQSDPRICLRHEVRARLLIEAAEMAGGVEQLHQLLARYYDGARWRRDRTKACNPYAAGTLDALAWNILTLDWSVLSAERIRHIIAEAATNSPRR